MLALQRPRHLWTQGWDWHADALIVLNLLHARALSDAAGCLQSLPALALYTVGTIPLPRHHSSPSTAAWEGVGASVGESCGACATPWAILAAAHENTNGT